MRKCMLCWRPHLAQVEKPATPGCTSCSRTHQTPPVNTQIVPSSYAAAAYLDSINYQASGKKVLCLANSGVEEVSLR